MRLLIEDKKVRCLDEDYISRVRATKRLGGWERAMYRSRSELTVNSFDLVSFSGGNA